MTDNGHVPDMITYIILLNGLCKIGAHQEAIRLLHEILKIVWHVVRYLVVKSSRCNWQDSVIGSELQLMKLRGDFRNNALGKLFETDKDSYMFLSYEWTIALFDTLNW